MLDLGNSFLSSVERDPDALAIVDCLVRMTYAQWYRRVSAVVSGFDELGLMPRRGRLKLARPDARQNWSRSALVAGEFEAEDKAPSQGTAA